MNTEHLTTKVIVEIKRPNGKVETVDISKNYAGMNDILFNRIKKATSEAGKGELLSYKVLETDLSEKMKTEIKAHDEKCRWFAKHGFNPNDMY